MVINLSNGSTITVDDSNSVEGKIVGCKQSFMIYEDIDIDELPNIKFKIAEGVTASFSHAKTGDNAFYGWGDTVWNPEDREF